MSGDKGRKKKAPTSNQTGKAGKRALRKKVGGGVSLKKSAGSESERILHHDSKDFTGGPEVKTSWGRGSLYPWGVDQIWHSTTGQERKKSVGLLNWSFKIDSKGWQRYGVG